MRGGVEECGGSAADTEEQMGWRWVWCASSISTSAPSASLHTKREMEEKTKLTPQHHGASGGPRPEVRRTGAPEGLAKGTAYDCTPRQQTQGALTSPSQV
eukprot:GGOE01006351.1.p3 GENE.GGOE01006351.1~~GGOE01006351.1.p3  ORF type:complete len:100 (-),score=2.88 GGOE01006351.1:1026-1325(-)